MSRHVIYTRAPREEVAKFIRQLPAALSGHGEDMGHVGAGFRARLGYTFFSLVGEEFDRLGRGQAASDGRRWPRNTPQHLAYSKGPKSSRMGRGRMPMNLLGGPAAHGGQLGRAPGTGDLTMAQLRRWWKIYGAWKALFLSQGRDIKEAKSLAAQKAWRALKDQGASTLLSRLGNRPDQVLVDRGTLRRSLLAGELVEHEASAEYQPNGRQQLFEQRQGQVIVGSRVRYAKAHHEGKGKLPKRPLWPDTFPQLWWDEIKASAVTGLARIRELFR